MAHIRTTTMNRDTDNIVYDYVKIYNSIFPVRLEAEYITLCYLVNSYIVLCNRLKKADNKSMYSVTDNSKYYQELECIENDLETLISKINAGTQSLSTEMKPNDAFELNDQVRRFSVLISRKNTINSTINKNNNTYYEQENDVALIRVGISDIVLQIKEQLEAIAGMDINTDRRIDSLEVKPHHLAMIDNWSILEDDKQALKDRLQKYFQFRVAIFKQVEKYAYDIIPAFAHRQVYDGEYNDVIPAIFALAGSDITTYNIGPYFSTTYRDEDEMYQFFIDYFNKNECDISLGERLMRYKLSVESKEAISDILDNQKKQKDAPSGPRK